MGQNAAAGVNKAVGTATGDINAAQNDVNAQVAAQDIAPNTDLVSQAAANPVAFVQNDQNLNDFLAQENASYTGPQSFSATPEYTKAQNSITKAQNMVLDPNTGLSKIDQPGGVREMVAGLESNPTAGITNLDSLLMQQTPGAMEPVQGAIAGAQGLTGQLPGMEAGINANIAKAISDTAAAKSGV
jgi:hypothetical protein